MDLFRKTGARFSPCRTWRYELWREWDASLPTILFLMLNPSVANEETNDPTAERCETRSRMMQFGRLKIVNLFALVSTYPAELRRHADPIGPDNDRTIIAAAKEADLVVCAWGKDGLLFERGRFVTGILEANGIKPMCLRVTPKTGQPQHPLYLPYSQLPIPYETKAA